MNISPSNSFSFIKQNNLLLRNSLSDLSFNLPSELPNQSSDIKKKIIEFQTSLVSQDEFLNEFVIKKKALTAFLEKFDLLEPNERESKDIYKQLRTYCYQLFQIKTKNKSVSSINRDFIVNFMQKLQNYQEFLIKYRDSMQKHNKDIMKQQEKIKGMAPKIEISIEKPVMNEEPSKMIKGKLEMDFETMKEELKMLEIQRKNLGPEINFPFIISPMISPNEDEESLNLMKIEENMQKMKMKYDETLANLKNEIEKTKLELLSTKEKLEVEEAKTSGYFFRGSSQKKQDLIKMMTALKGNLVSFEEKIKETNQMFDQEKKTMEIEKNKMMEMKKNKINEEMEKKMKNIKEMEETKEICSEIDRKIEKIRINMEETMKSIKEHQMILERNAEEKQRKIEKMKQDSENMSIEEQKLKKMMMEKEILLKYSGFDSEITLSDFSLKMQILLATLEEFVQYMKIMENWRNLSQKKIEKIFEIKEENEQYVEKIREMLEEF